MIQTVIFDMDGVIVDTEPVHKYAYYKHFEELGIAVSEELYTSFTGNSTKNVFEILKNKFSLAPSVAELIVRKRTIFNASFDTKPDLYLLDGVENLIQKLYTNNIQLILASSASKSTISRVFNRFNLDRFFTHKVSGEDFPKSKPHPAIFEFAANLSKAPKENCVVIEDSTNGVIAAKGANLKCIGYNSEHSKNQDLSKADKIITHFNQLDVFDLLK